MTEQFREYIKRAETNRRSAANMRTIITRMADNTWGTTVIFDSYFMSLTRDETLKLANLLVRDIDELDNRSKQTIMSRTRTRSYLERDNNE